VIASSVMPLIEWKAETLPARRLGMVGIVMALTGFLVNSIPHWMTLLDVPVY